MPPRLPFPGGEHSAPPRSTETRPAPRHALRRARQSDGPPAERIFCGSSTPFAPHPRTSGGTSGREREEGARLAEAVEHIRWRLWHGQVRRALDLVGETLTWLEGMADAAPAAAAQVVALLRGLETYVSGQADLFVDYAKARR